MGESHLDLLTFVSRAFECRRLGQGPDIIPDLLVDISSNTPLFAGGALGFQSTVAAIFRIGEVL